MAAIAVLVGATSCDKDTMMITKMYFYRFSEDGIIIMDNKNIEIGRKENTIKLSANWVTPLDDCEPPLAFAEGEKGRRRIYLSDQFDNGGDDFRTAEDALECIFHFNYVESTVRISGININDDDAIYLCLEPLILTATIEVQEEEKGYQKNKVTYVLKTESGFDVATTSQEIIIGRKDSEEDDDNG